MRKSQLRMRKSQLSEFAVETLKDSNQNSQSLLSKLREFTTLTPKDNIRK